MNTLNLLKIAFRALNNNKMRAFLTMLGIIIGVASVITMLSIGQGSKESIKEQISSMGANMIMIHPGADKMRGARQSSENMETLKVTDFKYLEEHCSWIQDITPSVTASGQFIYAANNYPSSMQGVSPSYLNIRQLAIASGQMFTARDIRTSAKVCVVGKTVKDNLFPNEENVIGKIIRFRKIPFRIVGVLEEKGYNTMGRDQDDVVLAPYTCVMKRVSAVTHLNSIYCSVIDERDTEKAISALSALLRESHQLKARENDDFNIRSQKELSEMVSTTTNLMTTLLASVAAISLFVGGIGIMNIMYVSVTERTREIGLRMSVGARNRDILHQFLTEAIIISLTGGVIGILLGVSCAFVVKFAAGWPICLQWWSIALSFTVCSLTGIFFGWYPAKKAANLDPIEAIRYE